MTEDEIHAIAREIINLPFELFHVAEVAALLRPHLSAAPAELANLLTGCAQILDVVKQEWGESWSEWDQGIRDGITAQLKRIYAVTTTLECKGRKSVGANDPQDCNWPFCDCDPKAEKVIEAIEESGFKIVPVSTTDEAGERTPQDHAIEFGEYLANLAEYYIRQRSVADAL